jgi:hypothetical protein
MPALLAALLLLPGCWSVLEPTVPRGAMPKVAPKQVLLQLDADVVADHAQAQIDQHLQVNLARDRHVPEGLAEAIQRRYLRTGMTPMQVLWVFRSHPTRIREQGPPGGHTWYWEPGRYWVRFDELGQLVQAGRY